MKKTPKKLRATITVDFDAKDYLDAGRIQEKLDELAKDLAKRYGHVELDMRERRERKSKKGKT